MLRCIVSCAVITTSYGDYLLLCFRWLMPRRKARVEVARALRPITALPELAPTQKRSDKLWQSQGVMLAVASCYTQEE
jgi:hypothetical protein